MEQEKENTKDESQNLEKSRDYFVDWSRTKKVPKAYESRNSGDAPYIKWGPGNSYPYFLNTLVEESPTHGGIIDKKLFYLTSGGFQIKPKLDSDESKNFIRLIEENGGDLTDYSFEDTINENCDELNRYSGFCFRGEWNFLTKTPLYIEPIGFDNIRTNRDATRFWYSDDWSQSTQSFTKTGFKEIPLIDLNNRFGEFIVYFRKKPKKTEGKGFRRTYPAPSYSGAIKSIMTEIEITNFHLFETLNGFKTGTLLFIPASKNKTENDKQLLREKIQDGATSREAAGGIMVFFSNGATEKPEAVSLNGNDQDKRYLQSEESVSRAMLKGHAVGPPALFDQSTEGKLGNNTELENGFEILKKTFVKSNHKIINSVYDWFIKKAYNFDADFSMLPPPGILDKEIPEGDTSAEIVNKLSKMPQFVAQKVLDSMSQNQLLALIDLPPVDTGNTPPVVTFTKEDEEFAAKDPILKALEKAGKNRSGFLIKESIEIPIERSEDWFSNCETEIFERLKNEKNFFATILTENQKNILSLIDKGEDLRSISSALKISMQDVMNDYVKLSEKGLIKKDNSLTATGKRYLDVTEISINDYEIRYSYELRPGAPRLKGESRPFCKKLIALDKLYTREEIDRISSAVNRDVFDYRGGWYKNPETKQNTPYCRHIWFLHVTVKKK